MCKRGGTAEGGEQPPRWGKVTLVYYTYRHVQRVIEGERVRKWLKG